MRRLMACWWIVSGCVVDSRADPSVAARIVASWEPDRCAHERQRIVVELEDDAGVRVTSSAGCRLGVLTLDVPAWGVYRGRVYAWMLGEPVDAVTPVTLTVDAVVVHWHLTALPW